MRQSAIAHPYLLHEIADLFPESVTIQEKSVVRDAYGAEMVTWADIPGLEDLPAAVEPVRQASGEEDRAPRRVTVNEFTVAIAGHYPAIRAVHRLRLWERTFEIVAAIPAPFRVYTHLVVREVV